jgi:signal transduction histidine kinase
MATIAAGGFGRRRRGDTSEAPSRWDFATPVKGAIDELLNQAAPAARTALYALDRLRSGVHALQALFWTLDGTTAHRALQAGTPPHAGPSNLTLEGRTAPIERLRRNGTVFCRFDEVSGIEELVPDRVRSFVAAAATRRNVVSSVLVLGWMDAVPPCEQVALAQLPIFTALLERAVPFSASVTPRTASDGVVATGPDSTGRTRFDGQRSRRRESAREEIAARLLAAQEAERSRIARDLHDDVGQQVVLLDAALDAALRGRWSRAQAQSAFLAARTKLQEIATSIHTLAHTLHPAKLKLLGLVQTLQALCRDVAVEAGREVRFEAANVPVEIEDDIVLSLFRVAQEALQNAVKHSGAHTIRVNLVGTTERLTLGVTDDGCGFDPASARSEGLGLLTMRERVELVGGTLRIDTARTRGTTIAVTVPWKPRVVVN